MGQTILKRSNEGTEDYRPNPKEIEAFERESKRQAAREHLNKAIAEAKERDEQENGNGRAKNKSSKKKSKSGSSSDNNNKEQEQQRRRYTAYKYSQNGKISLHEA